jgi:hypothetical protein
MQSGMPLAGLSLAQAPPLSIPASYFLTVPLSLLAAGSILMLTGATSLSSPWNPAAVALTHVATLGVLLMGMVGALYQMTPVVAGTPVAAIRLAHAVHFMLLFGLACFVWRLLGGPNIAMTLAGYSLGLALAGFLLPVGWSLGKSATRNETVLGMRLAVASLATIAVMGLVMARGYAGVQFPEGRVLWVQLHLTLALLGWVGGLIVAVSWQVIPMFYLASPTRKFTKQALLVALLSGLVLPFAAFAIALDNDAMLSATQWAAVASLPAAAALWIAHPLLTLHAIARRKRRRGEASLWFWRTGLVTAVLLFPLVVLAFILADTRWQILSAWLAIWGWAGMILHGMLTRIVPFLVWFHRIAPLLGTMRAPSMRSLLSQRRIRIGYACHVLALVLGAAAIVTQLDMLARFSGAMLAATGLSLGSSLLHVFGAGRGIRLGKIPAGN